MKRYHYSLLGLMAMTMALSACVVRPVPVRGHVSVHERFNDGCRRCW